jgi:single-strand DNA-binding protein
MVMNKVIMIGRLTGEPNISEANGHKFARFTLAVDRRVARNADGNQTTADFPSIVAFEKRAEFAEKYLHKGTKIAVVGRIQTGSYTNREGQKVYTTDIIAEELEFCESKKEENKPEEPPMATADNFVPAGDIDEELPFN